MSSGDILLMFGAVTGAGGLGIALLALRPFARTLCENWKERCRRKSFLLEEKARRKTRVAEIEAAGRADVARIEATGKILRELAELEPEQAERRASSDVRRSRPRWHELGPYALAGSHRIRPGRR